MTTVLTRLDSPLPWLPEVSRSRRAGAEIAGGGGKGKGGGGGGSFASSPVPRSPAISVPALRERETSGTQGNGRSDFAWKPRVL